MRTRTGSAIAGLVVSFGVAASAAESPEARFAAAQRIFNQARQRAGAGADDSVTVRRTYREAANAFAGLAADGVRSVNLCVNAANAYHLAGDPARALLWYLRANDIANTAETRGGVATLRRLCDAEPWPETRGSIGRALMFWHYDLTRITKQRIFFALFPAGCGLLLACVFLFRWRRVLVRVGLAVTLAGAVIGVSDVVAARYPPAAPAVVLTSAAGRAGNGESYSVVVREIRAGQEVKIVAARDNWLHVTLPSGTTCWLPASTVERV